MASNNELPQGSAYRDGFVLRTPISTVIGCRGEQGTPEIEVEFDLKRLMLGYSYERIPFLMVASNIMDKLLFKKSFLWLALLAQILLWFVWLVIPTRYTNVWENGSLFFYALCVLLYLLFDMRDNSKEVYRYHAVEHMVVNCISQGKEVCVKNVEKSSKIQRHCGSFSTYCKILVFGVFIVIFTPRLAILAYCLSVFWGSVLANYLKKYHRIWLVWPILWLGYLFQRLFLAKPRQDQIELGVLVGQALVISTPEKVLEDFRDSIT